MLLNIKRVFLAGLAVVVVLVATFITNSREAESIEWIPYTTVAVAENKADGKSSAVLFYARWALSADPRGGLATPAIHQALVNAGYIAMEADLTDASMGSFRELQKHGFNSVPVLVLYPAAGACIGFDGGTPESEIVSAVARPRR